MKSPNLKQHNFVVIILQLLLSSSLVSSELTSQDEDELCTELTTEQLAGTSPAILVCQNFELSHSREILNVVLFISHMCPVDKPVFKYYRTCLSRDSRREIRLNTDDQWSFRNLRRSSQSLNDTESSKECVLRYPPTRFVDVLFLLEQSSFMNEVKVRHVMNAIRTLTSTFRKRMFHTEARFSFVVYSLYSTHGYQFMQDFSSSDLENIHNLLESKMDSARGEIENPHYHSKLFHHLAVERSLKVLNDVFQLRNQDIEEVYLTNGEPIRLSFQPNADFHIISIFNLYEKQQDSVSEDKTRVEGEVEMLKRSIEEKVEHFVDNMESYFSSPTTLHFFFSKYNTAAKRYLGNPALSVHYSDCSHFNKALTLKALIGAGASQSNSLQAHLLSKGLESQVHTLGELAKGDCILGVSPALSAPSGVHPVMQGRCSKNDSFAGHKDFYCSPLHGWVKRELTTSRRLESMLFEGKAPLTTSFAASHADLASSSIANSSKEVLPQETLSINSKLDACKSKQQGTLKLPTVTGKPRVVKWKPSKPFVKEMIEGKEPVVLKNTVVQTWQALSKWNFTYLSENMGTELLESVKCTNSFLTFDPDQRTPLKLNISLPFTTANMTTKAFFSCIQVQGEMSDVEPNKCPDQYKGHYFFGKVPDTLKEDVMPDTLLYNTEKDYNSQKQFMWISSAGMITHTHFDQDYNFFVQLEGKKRFTLWSPSQHELMYIYPRIHPMWHKSRVNVQEIDLFEFPAFAQTRALQVELGPGDMLYVPPYYWHYVETLTPSVSLSTWSHDYELYDHMNSIYRHDHKFDLLEDQRGQMFVLRLYLDMMIHSLYGFNETTQFFARLINNRFSGLEHLFPPSEDDPSICDANVPGKIPTCIHVHGYAKLDMKVIGGHFEDLEPETRDILFQDYVEEITAQVVGIKKMLAFFRYCFLGQEYYVTDIDDEEHLLWDHKDIEDSS